MFSSQFTFLLLILATFRVTSQLSRNSDNKQPTLHKSETIVKPPASTHHLSTNSKDAHESKHHLKKPETSEELDWAPDAEYDDLDASSWDLTPEWEQQALGEMGITQRQRRAHVVAPRARSRSSDYMAGGMWGRR